MPLVSVYVRNEDMPLWKALEDKSKHVHVMLNQSDYPANDPPKVVAQLVDIFKAGPVDKDSTEDPPFTQEFADDEPAPPTDDEVATGAAGKPCCSGKKRCEHWQWNDTDSVWQNVLTGATAEADL